MRRSQEIRFFDYGCDAIPALFSDGDVRRRRVSGESVTVLKPHGSVNWLYCDACRETFWFNPTCVEPIAPKPFFRRKDWDFVEATGSGRTVLEPPCPICGANSLGTPPSRRSAIARRLSSQCTPPSWRTAEKLLKGASEWVFFGYSMPAADYEFKHLLKRVQLSASPRPNITLITGGNKEVARATVKRFRRFFGDVPGRKFLTKGLDGEALDHLEKIGVLKPSPSGAKRFRLARRGKAAGSKPSP